MGRPRQGGRGVAARLRHPPGHGVAPPDVTRRGLLWSGAAVALVYLVACVATMATGGHALRPLYEGIGPAAPYRWVDPPAQFKATNLTPAHASESIDLTATGSPQIGGETSDGQF